MQTPDALPLVAPDAAAPTQARWAIYFAPAPDTALARFGREWLARDADACVTLAPPVVPGLDAHDWSALTASARRYGFHATLKAPFRLRDGASPIDLARACAAFARTQRPLTIGALQVATLGDFLALLPQAAPAQLGSFAFACVRALDALRAPPTVAEQARRLAAGLTPRQIALLDGWGYPYVDDEYRFHMSLTGPLDEAQRAFLQPWLQARYAAIMATRAVTIDAISVYVEPAAGADLSLVARFALGV